MEEEIIRPLVIRYEGKDASKHELDLHQLGESLQGFAKVFGAAANLVATGQPVQHLDALRVRVVAVPVQEHHCFEFWSVLRPIVESKEFWAATTAAVLTPIIAYILSKRTKEEMKHLSDALTLALKGGQATTDRLLATVEKLAEALNPSVRKALSPIGRSCETVDLYAGSVKFQTMDADTKAAFAGGGTQVADHSNVYSGIISAFDMGSGACKVQLDGDAEMIQGRVVDPVFSEPNNPYALAMASKAPLRFMAKHEVDQAGKLVKLHIFDTAEDVPDVQPASRAMSSKDHT